MQRLAARFGAATIVEVCRRLLGSKINNLPLVRGDIIRLETSGDGGYGPVEQRSSVELERDRICRYAG